jgi:hypothetical protein
MRRRWSWLALTGLALSQMLAGLVGPELIAWWNRSAVATPFACDDAMLVAVRQFVRLSAGVSVTTVVTFVGAGLWWSRGRAASPPAVAATPAPPPTGR